MLVFKKVLRREMSACLYTNKGIKTFVCKLLNILSLNPAYKNTEEGIRKRVANVIICSQGISLFQYRKLYKL